MRTLLFVLITFLFVGCTSKGEPSVIGEILTPEMIENKSMEGKEVSIKGYPGLCKSFSVIKMKKRNKMMITSEPNCGGEELIPMNVYFEDGKGTLLFGDEPRNQIIYQDKVMTFITDDYQKLLEGEFIVSGKLVYEGDECYLNDVSIHPAK